MSTKSIKGAKIAYWIPTILLALFTLPGLFFMNSEMAIEGMRHVGLENARRLQHLAGFGAPLAILLILIPGVWNRLKEWAFVGLGIIYIGAFYAHLTIDGLEMFVTYTPLITLALLITAYYAWHKILKAKGETL